MISLCCVLIFILLLFELSSPGAFNHRSLARPPHFVLCVFWLPASAKRASIIPSRQAASIYIVVAVVAFPSGQSFHLWIKRERATSADSRGAAASGQLWCVRTIFWRTLLERASERRETTQQRRQIIICSKLGVNFSPVCVCIIYANRVACCCDFVPSAACRSELFVSKAGPVQEWSRNSAEYVFNHAARHVDTMLLKIVHFCNILENVPPKLRLISIWIKY